MDMLIPSFLQKINESITKDTNNTLSEEFIKKNFDEIIQNNPELLNEISNKLENKEFDVNSTSSQEFISLKDKFFNRLESSNKRFNDFIIFMKKNENKINFKEVSGYVFIKENNLNKDFLSKKEQQSYLIGEDSYKKLVKKLIDMSKHKQTKKPSITEQNRENLITKYIQENNIIKLMEIQTYQEMENLKQNNKINKQQEQDSNMNINMDFGFNKG